MKTIFTIAMLAVCAVIANYLIVFALNIAGLPGAIMAGKPQTRSRARFILGSVVGALGQSFIYLAFTAFIVNWTIQVINYQSVSLIVWPFAFLAVMLPLWLNLTRARIESREQGQASVQVEAMHITAMLTLLGFFIFAFVPVIMQTVYGWVPYVRY